MAEFVEKRCEEMIPELEQIERIKLLDKNEIREIAKKRKEYEYKIQRHTKCKEDYLRYIQYEMNLLKLIKQRRDKFGITQKKSAIDYSIMNKVNHLYKQAIFKFQDDVRFWIAHIKFCKHANFKGCISGMIVRMLNVHQDKIKCWHIAAMWEKEENNSIQNARQYLLRGLHFHSDSQLLLTDIFRLELEISIKGEKKQNTENEEKIQISEEDEIQEKGEEEKDVPKSQKRVFVTYKHILSRVKDIKFITELLNITKEYKDTTKLQQHIVNDLMTYYPHEPLVWDTMARRELEGSLPQPFSVEKSVDVDNSERKSLRCRIASCNEVYKTAVKKINTEAMWSLYVECMLEINVNEDSLPKYKRKLLKNALIKGHEAKKLTEKYYLHWIKMLNDGNKDKEAQKNVCKIFLWATEAVPESEHLWNARFRYLLSTDHKDAAEVFTKATNILGAKSLPLWKANYLYILSNSPEKTEEFFQTALNADSVIAKDMKPTYIEWLGLKKGIQAARNTYDELCIQPPFCLNLHKKMSELELKQPTIMVKCARRPFEMAVTQFGKSDTDVWNDYMLFEINHGDTKKVATLYNRAVKTLDATLTDKFITEYTLFKANPESMETQPMDINL